MKAMELKIENHKNALLREKQQKLLEIELKYKNKAKELERNKKQKEMHFKEFFLQEQDHVQTQQEDIQEVCQKTIHKF